MYTHGDFLWSLFTYTVLQVISRVYMLVPICRPDPICKLGVPVCKLGVFENAGKACVLETVP